MLAPSRRSDKLVRQPPPGALDVAIVCAIPGSVSIRPQKILDEGGSLDISAFTSSIAMLVVVSHLQRYVHACNSPFYFGGVRMSGGVVGRQVKVMQIARPLIVGSVCLAQPGSVHLRLCIARMCGRISSTVIVVDSLC